MKLKIFVTVATALFICACSSNNVSQPETGRYENFTPLFNQQDLDDWIVKIHKHGVGEDPYNTFKVEEGMIRVNYDGYQGDFDQRFSHLFYKLPFSNFHLKMEYRFVGEFYSSAPKYAILNSGVMYHSQSPQSILKDQNWPISVEMQFLAGLEQGKARPTGNMCSPGTDIEVNGSALKDHCLRSNSNTYFGDQWVSAELIVVNGKVTHIINGNIVMEYNNPHVSLTGLVKGFDASSFQNKTPLTSGYIGLQSEGHPIDFRNIYLKRL